MLFGIVSGLFWVLIVRQTGPHLGLHMTMLVMPGLIGLVLAGTRLRMEPVRRMFLVTATGFLVVNLAQSLGPWVLPRDWPDGWLFSDRHVSLSRPDLAEVQRLVETSRDEPSSNSLLLSFEAVDGAPLVDISAISIE